MSLSTSDNRRDYTGDGATAAYQLPVLVYDSSHVHAYLDGVETVSFTVSGVTDPAGVTVTFSSNVASGVIITLLRVVPETQLSVYNVGGAFPAKTTEKNLDLLCMISQQNSEELDRAVKSPIDETQDLTLPASTTRANKYFLWDSNGLPSTVDAGPSVSGTTVIAAGSTTARTLATRFGEIYNAQDYGAVGDDSTANDTAFDAVLDAAEATGGTVYVPRGTYRYTTSPTFARAGVSIIADRDTIFKHTGTGVAFNLDGGAVGGGLFGNYYENITVEGNSNSTHGFFARAIHHAIFIHIKVRGCATTGSGIRTEWCVLGTWINPTVSVNEGAFTSLPLHGMELTRRTGAESTTTQSIICPIMEGLTAVGGYGILLDYATSNKIINGTSESNRNGVKITANGYSNIIDGIDCEGNTTDDYLINGYLNTLRDCVGTAILHLNLSSAHDNVIDGGQYNTIHVDSTTSAPIRTVFLNVGYSNNGGTFTNNGTNTRITQLVNLTSQAVVDLEGSWTPSVGGTATYIQQIGRYTKIGRVVHITCNLEINVIGTGSTTNITGLPFTSASVNQSGAACYFTSAAASYTCLLAMVLGSASQITLFGLTAAAASVSSASAMGNGTHLLFELTYIV